MSDDLDSKSVIKVSTSSNVSDINNSDIVNSDINNSDIVNSDINNNNNINTRPNKTVIILALSASISGFMFGYDTGYISSALVQIGTDLSNKILSNGEKELITSATSLGALIGAIIGGLLANIIGRRMVLLGSNIIFVIGTIIQLVALHIWTMIAGRFILGWGVGCASLIAPLMLSELAPAKYRGRLIVVNGLFITGGQLIAYFINWGLTRVNHGWRVSVGLCMVPAIIQFILFFFLPDTPRFYVMNGNLIKAKKVLNQINNNPSPYLINLMIQDMIKSNSQVPGETPFKKIINSIKLIHKIPTNFRALILACGLQGIQQFTGFNSLMYFSATIFEALGFNNPTAVSIIIAATNFVFTCISMSIIDKIGRRRILLITIPCMCISLVICAIAFHFVGIKFKGTTVNVESNSITGWGIVIIISMVAFVASYASGIGTVAWTGVELFSDVNVRSVGAMYAAGTNWAGSLTIASTFLTMLENITPPGTFGFFAGLCAISFIFVYFLFPEVVGLELEETSTLLEGGFNVKMARNLARQRKNARKGKV